MPSTAQRVAALDHPDRPRRRRRSRGRFLHALDDLDDLLERRRRDRSRGSLRAAPSSTSASNGNVVRPGPVARADRPLVGRRPLDPERGVVPAHASRTPRARTACEIRYEHVRVVLQRLEPVRAAFGDVERPAVLVVEPNAVPRRVCRRARPEIEDDVEDRAATHRTSFASSCGARWKCMPRSVPARVDARDAALGELARQPGAGQLVRSHVRAKNPRSSSCSLELDHHGTGDRGLDEPHVYASRYPAQLVLELARRRADDGAAAAGRTSAPRKSPSVSADGAIRVDELLGAPPRVPLELEIGKRPSELARSRRGTTADRATLARRTRRRSPSTSASDLREVADEVVLARRSRR